MSEIPWEWGSSPYFLLLLYYFIYMVVFLYMCLYSVYISGAHGEQKRVSDILKLELQTVVCCRVGAENGTWETQNLNIKFVYLFV